MTWKDRYRNAKFDFMRRRTPAAFEACGGETMIVNYPKVNSTNGLTRCVVDFLNWSGHHAERINNMGVPKDNREVYVDVVGRTRIIGSIEYRKGTGENGTADIHATFKHHKHRFPIPVKIEIKWHKDKQSDDQIAYQEKIEAAGGVYIIAKNIDSFFVWYDEFMVSLENGSNI